MVAAGVPFMERCGDCHGPQNKRNPKICNPFIVPGLDTRDACNICHNVPIKPCTQATCPGWNATTGVCP